MAIPTDTVMKMQSLSPEKLTMVVNFVNQLTLDNPVDIFSELCKNGAENPMTEEDVYNFVSNVRAERNDSCN